MSPGSLLKVRPWHHTDLEMAEVSINFWASAFQGKDSELVLVGPAFFALIFHDIIALVKRSLPT